MLPFLANAYLVIHILSILLKSPHTQKKKKKEKKKEEDNHTLLVIQCIFCEFSALHMP